MKVSAALIAFSALSAFAFAQEKDLFNGKDLTGWDGNPELWSVKDGAITGQTTPEKPAKTNTFLIWKGGDVADFELTLKYKFVEPTGNGKDFANSGIQYRSKVIDPAKWSVGGYQADFEAGPKFSGILYEEQMRGILALRGQKVVVKDGEPGKAKIEETGTVGKSEEIQAAIKPTDWNEYKIVAKGNHLQHFINGKATADITDESTVGAKTGVLALQLHSGPPMTVQFKDIKLKEMK